MFAQVESHCFGKGAVETLLKWMVHSAIILVFCWNSASGLRSDVCFSFLIFTPLPTILFLPKSPWRKNWKASLETVLVIWEWSRSLDMTARVIARFSDVLSMSHWNLGGEDLECFRHKDSVTQLMPFHKWWPYSRGRGHRNADVVKKKHEIF